MKLVELDLFGPLHNPPRSGPASWLMLAIFIAVCLCTGALGSVFVFSSLTDWYPGLEKPRLVPPDSAFPAIWSTLYVTMGYAAWRVWRKTGLVQARFAFIAFGLQLLLNLLWTVLFFGLRAPLAAFIEAIILVIAIRICQLAFVSVDRIAGWIMVPYMAWSIYAIIITALIALKN